VESGDEGVLPDDWIYYQGVSKGFEYSEEIELVQEVYVQCHSGELLQKIFGRCNLWFVVVALCRQ